MPNVIGDMTWLKRMAQIAILFLVCWGIVRVAGGAQVELREIGLSLRDLDSNWLLASALLYLTGLIPFCVFWHLSLLALGQRPLFRDTLRAYYIGHLGKYVPGKAVVVILRIGLIRGPQVKTSVAAASVFLETLTMVTVGAVVAFLLLGLVILSGENEWIGGVGSSSGSKQKQLAALAAVLAVCAVIPTLPPIFRRILALFQIDAATTHDGAVSSGLDFRLIAAGWSLSTIGWLLLGMSLWALLQAVPGNPITQFWYDLPLVTACVSLAVVAGFLSLIPGGLGVREFVVLALLSPTYGTEVAIVAAVALRLVWLTAELGLAGLLYIGPLIRKPASSI